MSKPLSLTPELAAAIAVERQGFAARRLRGSAAVARAAIQRLGCVQIDSVSVVARAHLLTLSARIGRVSEEDLNLLRRRGEVFEYWAHEACLLPSEEYRFFRARMAKRTDHHWFGPVLAENRETARAIMAEIEANGPSSIRDFGGAGSGYWEWKPAKRVLESLWTAGELAVVERRGFERVYDLTERVIPAAHLRAAPDEQERLRHFILRTVGARGVVTTGRLRDYFRLSGRAARIQPALQELIDEGALVAARVGDWEAVLDREAAARAGGELPEPATAVLLCPFDNLVWDREESRRIFGFSHILEIYKPDSDRRYGYYVLPLLVGGRIVGRMDLKRDQRAGELRVVQEHWEGRPQPAQLKRALERLAWVLGVEPVHQP